MENDCPCKECVEPKRHTGCHSECTEYLDWKAAEEERKAIERKRKEDELALFNSFKPRRRR